MTLQCGFSNHSRRRNLKISICIKNIFKIKAKLAGHALNHLPVKSFCEISPNRRRSSREDTANIFFLFSYHIVSPWLLLEATLPPSVLFGTSSFLLYDDEPFWELEFHLACTGLEEIDSLSNDCLEMLNSWTESRWWFREGSVLAPDSPILETDSIAERERAREGNALPWKSAHPPWFWKQVSPPSLKGLEEDILQAASWVSKGKWIHFLRAFLELRTCMKSFHTDE